MSIGKTCLGEAAKCGNCDILKFLVDKCPRTEPTKFDPRKLKKTVHPKEKYNPNHKLCTQAITLRSPTIDFLECRIGEPQKMDYLYVVGDDRSFRGSPLYSVPMMPSPHDDLEWDEDIGNAAPVTSDDESWCAMYR